MSRKRFGILGVFLLCILVLFFYKPENGPGYDEKAPDHRDLEAVTKAKPDILKAEAAISSEGYDNLSEDITMVYDARQTASGQNNLMEAMKEYPAGTRINAAGADQAILDTLFYYEELNEATKDRINGKSYGEACDVSYEELRYVRILHKGFDDKTYIGELIVNQAIAQDILDIFRELYRLDYPIERMVLVDEYDADDIKSMEANNSSAFNFRFVDGTTRRSLHSDGVAIDINPLYNPYVRMREGKLTVLPENGTDYVDRTKDCPYYIKEGDSCYNAFIKRGFTWGGAWDYSKDYQHFEKKLEN